MNEVKALIIYHSQQHGNTRKMAEAVAEGFEDGVPLWNTNEKRFDVTEIPEYDCIAVGLLITSVTLRGP